MTIELLKKEFEAQLERSEKIRSDYADKLEAENNRLRNLLQQVLVDAHSQDVLLEWWHLLETNGSTCWKKGD